MNRPNTIHIGSQPSLENTRNYTNEKTTGGIRSVCLRQLKANWLLFIIDAGPLRFGGHGPGHI